MSRAGREVGTTRTGPGGAEGGLGGGAERDRRGADIEIWGARRGLEGRLRGG